MIRRASGDLPGAVADMEQCLALARASADAQVLAPALIVAGSVFFEAGRRNEAATLAREALEMGIRLVIVSNNINVVDAAWLMRDVGLQADLRGVAAGVAADPMG